MTRHIKIALRKKFILINLLNRGGETRVFSLSMHFSRPHGRRGTPTVLVGLPWDRTYLAIVSFSHFLSVLSWERTDDTPILD